MSRQVVAVSAATKGQRNQQKRCPHAHGNCQLARLRRALRTIIVVTMEMRWVEPDACDRAVLRRLAGDAGLPAALGGFFGPAVERVVGTRGIGGCRRGGGNARAGTAREASHCAVWRLRCGWGGIAGIFFAGFVCFGRSGGVFFADAFRGGIRIDSGWDCPLLRGDPSRRGGGC